MKSARLLLLFGFLVYSCFFVSAHAEAKIRIDITSPGLTRFPISIAPFKAMTGSEQELKIAHELYRRLEKNLKYTGFFEIVNPSGSLQNPQQMGITKKDIQFKAWSLMGVEILITGGVTFKTNELDVEMRLFEISEQKLALGKRYSGDIGAGQKIANRFGNEVMEYLTGFKGYFQSKIAFVSGDHHGKEIYAMDFDGGNVDALTSFKSLTLTPRWSPSGNEMLFVSYKDRQPDLFLKNLNTGNYFKISNRKGLNISPAWSPSGKEIVITLSKGGDENLYLIDRRGRIIRQLTNRWGINVSTTWAPGGDRIAFVSNRSGNAQIYIKNLTTGEVERLTIEGKRNLDPHWSPRGDRIVFSGSINGGFEIFTIRPDGGDLQQLTYTGGLNLSPSWSPDGSMIVFSSNRQGEKAIFVMNSNGANQRRLTFLKGAQESPSWSPNLE